MAAFTGDSIDMTGLFIASAGITALTGEMKPYGDFYPPIIDTVSPTSGTTLASSSTGVSFNMWDSLGSAIRFAVWLVRTGETRPYLVHNGTAFVGPFDTGSTLTGSGTYASPYVFTIKLNGGWWNASGFTLYARAVDAYGNTNNPSVSIGNWTTADGQIYLANTNINTGMQTP